MRPRTLLAVAVSAVLGVALGVGAGLLVDHRPSPMYDPLGLGVPMVNQYCTGGSLVRIAFGPGTTQLAADVATYGSRLHYLDTGASCRTTWTLNGRRPHYVTYLGPFDTKRAACDIRMAPGHEGTEVIPLDKGATSVVPCACYFSPDAMPTLSTGEQLTARSALWTRSLKEILSALGRHSGADHTGVYDDTTAAEVRRFQLDKGLSATGVVDSLTWKILQKNGCRLF